MLGMLICTEAALFVLTVLPLRVLLGLYTRARYGRMHRTQRIDLLKVACIALALGVLLCADARSIRTFIDSQSHLKLHMFFAMLQVIICKV